MELDICQTIHIAQFFKFINFQKKINLEELKNLFRGVQIQVEKVQDQNVTNLKQIPEGQTKGYYIYMINYMDIAKYNTNIENRKKIAKAYSELALIHLRSDEVMVSASQFNKALEFNPEATDFTDVYNNLVLCFHKEPKSINFGTSDRAKELYK